MKNIQQIDLWTDIHCNDGVTCTNWVGYLPGVGCLWYYPNEIDNILYLSKMAKHFRITYDIWGRNAFEVHKSAGAVRYFVEYPKSI